MNCPSCALPLQTIALEPHLPAHSCPQCNGVWIASSDYWAWLEQPDTPDALTVAETSLPSGEPE